MRNFYQQIHQSYHVYLDYLKNRILIFIIINRIQYLNLFSYFLQNLYYQAVFMLRNQNHNSFYIIPFIYSLTFIKTLAQIQITNLYLIVILYYYNFLIRYLKFLEFHNKFFQNYQILFIIFSLLKIQTLCLIIIYQDFLIF